MLTVRPTAPNDLEALISWETERDTSMWLGETGPAWHARALADPDQEHVVATDGGTPVGFAVLAGLHRSEDVELRRIVIAPARRGTGRGRALLQAVLDWAYQQHGARTVWLDVKKHNHRARSLYESSGFTERETHGGATAEPDGTASDLVIMVHQSR
ncbi:GNAT family N-acetyltransferase [Streptomyces sp. MUM 203J]|uniref:GNAT family N-acetyltransferase n=1 Tax=Streptomyces sp. MUM 203J TaxID=2791990 RepID=UPI001F049444|nr:GNAT family N-acetyltransferase [Streptomyces sp. MUM 203J]MCH0542688.1 GNAT family N-acetyltransferase [Streptomyces sp. MUM 203J]